MRRSFGFATTVAIALSLVSAILTPGIAKATPSDTTNYSIICASSGRVNIYLDYGISSLTITNPNSCGGSPQFYVSSGRSSTWTYSQTSSGATTSGSYDPEGINLHTAAIGSSDSFTLTLTSSIANSITFSGGGVTLDIQFNTQFNTLTPSSVAIGEQVILTGNNLSSVTAIGFRDGLKYFVATTANRTATQLTFTVPSVYVDWRGISTDVTPGTYSITSAPGKSIVVSAAAVVASVSNEEFARHAALVAGIKREAEKRSARDSIVSKLKSNEKITLETLIQAEVNGITPQNIEAVQAEIAALPVSSSGDITGILKIARKYEVVGIIGSERISSITSKTLVEVGFIPADSKFKATLTAAIKKLPLADRSSYVAIQEALAQEMATIQARQDRLAKIKALVESRRRG